MSPILILWLKSWKLFQKINKHVDQSILVKMRESNLTSLFVRGYYLLIIGCVYKLILISKIRTAKMQENQFLTFND